MAQDQLINTCLSVLKFYGFHPLTRKVYNTILKILQLTVSGIVLVLLLIDFVVNSHNFSIDNYCKSTETFVTVLQVLNKAFALEVCRKLLADLLNERVDFWPVENINEKLNNEINTIYYVCLNTSKAYSYAAIAVIISYMYIGGVKRELLFSTYVPDSSILTADVILIIQFYFLIGGVLIVVSFDCLFVALCVKIITQLKLVTYKFDHIIEFKDRDAELTKCVKHHLFLTEYLQKAIDFYSTYFVFHYFITLLSIGVHMFMFLDEGANLQQLAIAGFYGMTIVIQLGGCYCFPAEAVNTQMLEITKAIYNCKWYTVDKQFCLKLLLVLIASQKEKQFTASGISTINRAAFTNIFRASMSMFMFIKTLKEK